MFDFLASFNFTAIKEEIIDAHNQLMEQLPINASTFTEGPSMVQEFRKFVVAVDWTSEPAFFVLLLFHLLMYAAAFTVVARSSNRIMMFMCVVFPLVFCATYLNDFGAKHYDVIFYRTKINYFDTHGIFISAVWSGPLTVLSFLLQVKLIFVVFGLMADLKKIQIMQQRRKEKDRKEETQQQEQQEQQQHAVEDKKTK